MLPFEPRRQQVQPAEQLLVASGLSDDLQTRLLDHPSDVLDPLMEARARLSSAATSARKEAEIRTELLERCDALHQRRNGLQAVGVQLAGARGRVQKNAQTVSATASLHTAST